MIKIVKDLPSKLILQTKIKYMIIGRGISLLITMIILLIIK